MNLTAKSSLRIPNKLPKLHLAVPIEDSYNYRFTNAQRSQLLSNGEMTRQENATNNR